MERVSGEGFQIGTLMDDPSGRVLTRYFDERTDMWQW